MSYGLVQRARGRRARPLGRGLGSLGDDSPTAPMGDMASQQLAELRRISEFQRQWVAAVEGEKLQKWIQIGVTASIPLFAALWRIIFKTGSSE